MTNIDRGLTVTGDSTPLTIPYREHGNGRVSVYRPVPGLAIHPHIVDTTPLELSETEWTLTHEQSGRYISFGHKLPTIRKIAKALAPLADWTQSLDVIQPDGGLADKVWQVITETVYPVKGKVLP